MPSAKKKAVRKPAVRKGTSLKQYKAKKVKPDYVKKFWREWKSPEKVGKHLLPKTCWGRKVWALSLTTLVTVRRFSNKTNAKIYVKKSKAIERKIMKANPQHFVLQPIQFFGIRRGQVLERVYPGSNYMHLNAARKDIVRYKNLLQRKLKRKGTSIQKADKMIGVAVKELQKIQQENNILPAYKSNILVLDFDPKTGKTMLAIIDHERIKKMPESLKE